MSVRTFPLSLVALVLMALSMLAYWPYLTTGFFADDYLFVSMLEGAVSYDPLPGFWYTDIDSYPVFRNLWWKDPGVGGAFLRPLASWTLILLYQVFGRNAVPYHIVLLLIHALGAFTLFLILRRLSGMQLPSLITAVLFLICEDHGMTVTWISTITDLLCFLFINLAFLCHIRGRQEQKTVLYLMSLLFSLAAVTSKETGVVYPLIIVAYELFYADELNGRQVGRSVRERVRIFLQNWKAWVIPLSVVAAYMLFYRSIIPPMSNLMYIDLFAQPWQYLEKVFTNLPVMCLGLLSQFLPSLVILSPETLVYAIAAGILLSLLFIRALSPYRGERTVWFSLAVFLLTLLPGLSTEPGERILYIPSAYGMFAATWLVIHTTFLKSVLKIDKPWGVSVLGRVFGYYLLVSVVIIPVVLLFVYPSMWIPGMKLPDRTVVRSLPLIEEDFEGRVIYLNTNSSFNTFYLSDIYRYHRGHYVGILLLSSFNGHVWARQDDDNTLSLKVDSRGWLSNMFARIVRVNPTFTEGQEYTNQLFSATVVEVFPGGEDVREVRFRFAHSLGDPSLLFLYYDGKTFRNWQPSTEWELLNTTIEPYGF